MTDEERQLRERVRRASPGAADALGDELRAQGRRTFDAAAAMLDDGEAVDRARAFLEQSRELGLRALVSRPPADAGPEIEVAVRTAQALRGRLVAWLESLLGHRATVPLDPTPWQHEEERPPPRRVCDVAYLGIRQLLHFGEDEVAQASDGDCFLHLPDADKDRIIAAAFASKDYRHFELPEPPDDPDGP